MELVRKNVSLFGVAFHIYSISFAYFLNVAYDSNDRTFYF